MHLPSRARRILKWTAAGVSLLIISIWVASYWWEFTLVFTRNTVAWTYSGSIRFVVADFNVVGEWDAKTHVRRRRYLESGFRRLEFEDGLLTTLRPYPAPQDVYSRGLIPLWVPLLLTAIPTAWLWHRDRRLLFSSPDHPLCIRCGYNLAGNTSGVCPECGDKACRPAVLADSECDKRKPERVRTQ